MCPALVVDDHSLDIDVPMQVISLTNENCFWLRQVVDDLVLLDVVVAAAVVVVVIAAEAAVGLIGPE